jgi:hypothetical protein
MLTAPIIIRKMLLMCGLLLILGLISATPAALTLDRQIIQRQSQAKTEKVVINIVLVLLGLSAFLPTVLGIWWLVATGGSSYPNLGIAILSSSHFGISALNL